MGKITGWTQTYKTLNETEWQNDNRQHHNMRVTKVPPDMNQLRAGLTHLWRVTLYSPDRTPFEVIGDRTTRVDAEKLAVNYMWKHRFEIEKSSCKKSGCSCGCGKNKTEDRRKDTGMGMVMRQIELRANPNYIETINTPPRTSKRETCPCGSGKSTFKFEGKNRCANCAPITVGD